MGYTGNSNTIVTMLTNCVDKHGNYYLVFGKYCQIRPSHKGKKGEKKSTRPTILHTFNYYKEAEMNYVLQSAVHL